MHGEDAPTRDDAGGITRREFVVTSWTLGLCVARIYTARAQGAAAIAGSKTTMDDALGPVIGPFLGASASGVLRVWMREPSGNPFEIELHFDGQDDPSKPRVIEQGDGCGRVLFSDLPPEASRTSAYLAWKLEARVGEPARQHLVPIAIPRVCYDSIETARLALGSCASEEPDRSNTAWNAIFRLHPDGLLLLGDTPHIDATDLAEQRRRYREFYSDAGLAALMRLTPTWATWIDQDHETDADDQTAEERKSSRHAFLEYHALATYGDDHQGIYTRFELAAAEVFVLDTRWFRGTEPSFADATKKTLLGHRQWAWLTKGLRKSRAIFKVLACGRAWSDSPRPNESDSWMAYPHERHALFEFIARESIGGVVLVSGGGHRSRAYEFAPETTGVAYPLCELGTSPLGDPPMDARDAEDAASPDVRFHSGAKHQFLLLDIEPTKLVARFHTAADGEIHRMEIDADDVRPFAAITPTPREEDWAKARTELVMKRANVKEADVLFLGDSITEGWESTGSAPWAEHFAPMKCVNLGVSGERTENILWRIDHGQLDGFAKNVEPPKLVVLLIGTNNFGYGDPSTPDETARGVGAVVARIRRKLPATRVLVLAILPRGDQMQVRMRAGGLFDAKPWLAATNTLLARLADGALVTFQDLDSHFLEADGSISEDVMADKLHLTAEGYRRWAVALAPEVRRSLAR